MKRDRNNSGFTLIELLVVIAIIGVISGTVLVKSDLFSIGSGQEFKQILAFLRLQHARTLRTNSSVLLRINPDKKQLIAVREDRVLDQLTLDQWTVIEPDREFSLELSPYRFRPEEIILRNRRGQERSIRTDWTTGFGARKK